MAAVGVGMEVDPPPTSASSHSPPPSSSATTSPTAGPLNPLKRSNSAPMINVLVSSTSPSASTACSNTTSSPTITIPPQPLASPGSLRNYERVRRFSASSMSLHSPTTPVKVPSRLDQIKQEERFEREAAHEKEIQSTMQMSQSWEELTLDDHMITDQKRPKSFGEPLHILTSHYPYASSPSPTRVGKQCFSPSLQQPVRNVSLTPSPSPSPTRKTFTKRSSSPITLRPSPLGCAMKRKMELESGDRVENYFSPPKRFQPSISPGASTPDRLSVLTHPLIHSISSSSLEDTGSPEQTVPSLTHAHPVSSVAHSTTSMVSYAFRPVQNSHIETQATCTDSETSDMTETTDISEHSEGVAGHSGGETPTGHLSVSPLFSSSSLGKPTSL